MDPEVIIVGAGAAGIAATRRLQDRGARVSLVEAMGRVGGRAYTQTVEGLPLDLGCGWLHSAERNPLAAIAEAQGMSVDRSPAAWQQQYRNLGFTLSEQRAAANAYVAFEQRLHENIASDRASDAVPGDDPWRNYLDMLSGALNGAELDRVSAADLLAYDDSASETNWRLPAGYGALFARLAVRLPISLGTRVISIDATGEHVIVETNRGRLTGGAVIVAVPTDILARGDIAFQPAVDDHLHAAAKLPLGRVDKLFLSLSDPTTVPPETHLLGNPRAAQTGSYYMRPMGMPVIECFFGGIAARAMEEAGDAGRNAFAREELSALLGTGFAKGLRPLAGSWWHREPTIGGAYSHALPGYAGRRAILAAPANDRLHFAGEACSPHDFSTAHGAWQSGIDAADRVAKLLRNGA